MNRDAEIFAEAIELAGAERVAFLDRACAGDAALRQRVEQLIRGYEGAGLFLEDAPVERLVLPTEDPPGTVIGRYTLIRKLGEGGCGVVYLAEQQEPVRRQVALKVIRLGMDTRSVVQRFEAERQALAMMDHPDIARVLDAGATASGRPFFVMEYVDGVPITKFCDEHSLDLDARLELFARVCIALQHAHQKGIIHRDLKPSNILVARRDGGAAPKIIDFGIAKATQGRLTEQTLITGFNQFIGTPAYMSPEQVELRDLDIDTRSDVYSLGVLLYELLTGRPPYDPKSLVQAGVDEIRRIIREVDPPKPSTRVSTLGDADLATVAKLRQAAPMQLTSILRGDLDWIVMRCLEKDRDRRYGSAVELAEDVRRHLRSEPVNACPPSTLYRVRKFVARNRLVCTSAAAIALALVVGTVVSTQQAIRARRAEREAQRQRDQAESLLAFMLGDYRTNVQKLGKTDLLDNVGTQAERYFAEFDLAKLSDFALQQHAKMLYQIGQIRMDQARFAEAEAAFQGSYRRAAALVARQPRNADMLFERAQAEYYIGHIARRRGDFATTREWYVRYRDSSLALLGLEGRTPRAQREVTAGEHNLAVLEMDRGDLAAARQGFLAERAAVAAMRQVSPNDIPLRGRVADVASWLGRVAEADGRYADALDHGREMNAALDELVALEPNVPQWKARAATNHVFSAQSLAALGRRTEAATALAQARAIYDELTSLDPKNANWQAAAATVRIQQVALLLAAGDTATAASLLQETRAKLEALFAAEPSVRSYSSWLVAAWTLEGRVRQATGNGDALAAAQQAIALGEPLIRDSRADLMAHWQVAQALLLAGRLEQARNQPAAARPHWDRVLALLGPRADTSNDWRALDPVAQAYVLTGQAARARPLIEKLQRFGYRPIDPFAAPVLGVAP